MALSTVIIATLCVIIIYAKVVPWIRSMIIVRRAMNKIPGPGYPIVGVTYTLLTMKMEDLLNFFRKHSLQYNGIYAFWIGIEPFVLVSDPKYLKVVLRDTVNIEKMRIYKYLKAAMGHGLLTSAGEKWQRDRKMLTPTFHLRILEEFVPIMWNNVNIMVDDIRRSLDAKPGEAVEMFELSLRCALSIICETSMGVSVHSHVEGSSNHLEAAETAGPMAYYRLFRPWLDPDWMFYKTSIGKECKRCTDAMRRFAVEVIVKRMELRKLQKESPVNQKEDDDTGASKSKALLDYLLDISDQLDEQLTTDEVWEHVSTFIITGYDTTACSISWTLFCLAHHPECQQRLYEEIRDKLGISNVAPTQKELFELDYLDRVLKESLRLFPAGPMLGRKLVEQMQIDDYLLPKGTAVVISPYITHRDPNSWPNPEAFNPERFLPENTANRNPYAYIPFSAGPRNCIGQKYATLEVKLAIVAVLRIWIVECLTPMGSEQVSPAFVLRPANGLHFRFKERERDPVS